MTVDILVLIVFAGSLLYGFKQGAMKQLAGMAGLVLGVIGCRLFGNVAEGIMPSTPAFAAPLLSNAFVFAVIYMATTVVIGMARKVTKVLHLSLVDKAAGALMAMLKWMVGLSVLLNVYIAVKGEPFQEPSALTEATTEFAPWLWGVTETELFSTDSVNTEDNDTAGTADTPRYDENGRTETRRGY